MGFIWEAGIQVVSKKEKSRKVEKKPCCIEKYWFYNRYCIIKS